jgi:hypothetical protein
MWRNLQFSNVTLKPSPHQNKTGLQHKHNGTQPNCKQIFKMEQPQAEIGFKKETLSVVTIFTFTPASNSKIRSTPLVVHALSTQCLKQSLGAVVPKNIP